MRNRIQVLHSRLGRTAVALIVLTAAASARAAQGGAGAIDINAAPAGGAHAPAEAAARAPAPPPPLEAIVHGFFIATRLGGGYLVMGDAIPEQPPAFDDLEGLDEGYGPGSMLQVEIGYDIASVIAIEVMAGASVVSGTRTDWVRDLGLAYGGLALRLAPGLTDRLRVAITAGGGYAVADNTVEPRQTGPAAFGSIGLEYYVHVRHFSIGLDVSVIAPVNPLRVFVGVGPQLKYTF